MKFLLSFIFILLSYFLSAQKPGIVFPKNGQVLQDTFITILWDAHPNATQYQLTLASDSLFQNLVVNAQSTTDNRQPITLTSNQTYHGFVYYYTSTTAFSSDTFSFTVFSPKDIDSLLVWLSADDGVIKDSLNKVTQWLDRSGNNHNAIPTTYNYAPVFQEEINQNIYFDGTNKLNLGDVDFNNYSFIISNKPLTIGSNYKALLSKYSSFGSNGLISFISSGRQRSYQFGNTSYSYQGKYYNYNQLSQDILIYNGSNRIYTLNNSFTNPFFTNLLIQNNADLIIGGRNGDETWNYTGRIFEIIIYNKAIGPYEQSSLYKYTIHKYTPPVNIGSNILRRYGFCDTVLRTEKMYESYLWSTGDTTRQITVGYQDTGWYWCEVPNLYGQIMRDSVYVYNFLPKQDIQDTTICLGDTITYLSSYAQGYQIPNIQPGTLNFEPSTLNFEPSTLNIQPTTHNSQPTTHNSQPTTSYNGYSFLWTDLLTNDTLSNTPALTLAPSSPRTFVLSVKDTLGCFITDTFHIFIDSFPVTTSLGSDKSLCTGDKIGLATGNNEADTFLWNTGSSDSLIVINTAGTYSLQTWNPRGCLAKDTVEVDIHGVTPYVAFSALPVCFGDSTTFIDSSMSLDQSNLISWEIDLGDGSPVRPLAPSPYRYLYSKDTTYTARLTVSTDSGCTNYAYGQVLVRPLPQPNFMPLTACQNHNVQLQNLSVHADSLISYRWIFNQIDTLFANSPIRQFANSGPQSIQLTPFDIHGCNASITKTFTVRPTPQADFTYTTNCEGEPIHFSDGTATELYNPIQTVEWLFPNSTHSITDLTPSFLFDSAGYHPVKLTVTSLNGCWDTITKMVALHPYAKASLYQYPLCENQTQIFYGMHSVLSPVPVYVLHRVWTLDNDIISADGSAFILLNDTLNHKVKFYIKTAAGCEDSVISFVKAHPRPQASFTFDRQYGLPPLEVQFTNTSNIKYSSPHFSWTFGDGNQSQVANPTHIYLDSNIYYPQLIITDSLGCIDTASAVLYVIYASIDIAVVNTIATLNGDYLQYSCELRNYGKQPLQSLNLQARYNDGNEISETWQGLLESGQSMTYTFQSRVKVNNPQELRYYCIEASLPATATQEDEQPANNILCKDWTTEFWVGNPYPNPVSTELQLDLVLPVKQQVEMQITTLQGRKLQTYNLEGKKGLNQVRLKLDQYQTGNYLLVIQTPEHREVRSFVVE